MPRSRITDEHRQQHREWLAAVTRIPTAAGREGRVVDWVCNWFDQRPDLAMSRDASGNLVISFHDATHATAPLYITAHLDHPAFVVDEVVGKRSARLAFRGGVMAEYFVDADVEAFTADGERIAGRITETPDAAKAKAGSGADDGGMFPEYLAEFDASVEGLVVGDVARWSLGEPGFQELASDVTLDGGPVECVMTDACDDLAAVAAGLGAMDVLRGLRAQGEAVGDVRLLLTRAEEIGFVGAIGACRDGTIERGARLIALENSRAFADSPIGGGPIVRVGDRLSIFTPALTAAVASVAESISGGPAEPKASQKRSDLPDWRWQRKLMAGGACEASVFCEFGHAATCVCLPLGNYHNMADLDAAQAGTLSGRPRVGQEHVAVSDYNGLIDLLVGCGLKLASPMGEDLGVRFRDRLDKLWGERCGVLREPVGHREA
ncbi:MAG: hypothetical protein AAF747_00180 [Planctomycetota bacterium]